MKPNLFIKITGGSDLYLSAAHATRYLYKSFPPANEKEETYHMPTNNLQPYFPMIRTRQQIESEIKNDRKLLDIFEQWSEDQQQAFLDFCTGAKGVKMLYDSFFKAVMDPEAKPDRMESLLSLILGQKVKILKALPNESMRISDEVSLLIMDMVVQLANGSIVNIECQKIGYAFPGQRAACYSADLLMRQYRRVKKERKEQNLKFSYRNIKPVYTIIFYETSPKEYHDFNQYYIHRSKQQTDTGIQVNLLQEFVFLPLDIYFKYHHNKGIRNELEAWLTFLGSDKPEDIIELIGKYPKFKEMYEDVYQICRNTERVMEMFSKELQELDKNTVLYMIDEMQAEIDGQAATIDAQAKQLTDKDTTIDEQNATIDEQAKLLADRDTMINEQHSTIDKQNTTINEQDKTIIQQKAELDALKARIAELEYK